MSKLGAILIIDDRRPLGAGYTQNAFSVVISQVEEWASLEQAPVSGHPRPSAEILEALRIGYWGNSSCEASADFVMYTRGACEIIAQSDEGGGW